MAEKPADEITGAEAIIGSLADCGVTACFANPGTSEMHLVTALDREPRIRSVLCLFEGVATGAADGFARMTGRPALTLLHLGPGYLNGGANIHNARRAFSPMINLIGDHAVPHRALDAPLASDIPGLAGPNSRWMKSVDRVEESGPMAVEAYAASFGPPPGPVSLIMPADTAWTPGGVMGRPAAPAALKAPEPGVAEAAATEVRKAKKPTVLVNGAALLARGLDAIARLQAAGVRVISDTFMPRVLRGAGRQPVQRLTYFAEIAVKELEDADLLLIAGTKAPVSFFAYPNTPSVLAPRTARQIVLGGPETDSAAALEQLADALGAEAKSAPAGRAKLEAPSGRLTPYTAATSLNRLLPDGAIVADDGVTSSLPIFLALETAAAHDWLGHTGGAIGQGMPMATGAAIGAPDRKVVCLAGDGAGMYTVQALWTMAREQLDVTVIVFVNNCYRILKVELARTGAGDPGPIADSMLSLGEPAIDWVKLAEGMGVAAESADTAEAFDAALARAMARRGPRLIAASVPA